MKILFTGASSFTGFWFAKTLAEAGHTVHATFQGKQGSYESDRKRRIEALPDSVERLWETPLNSPRLLEIVSSSADWDLVCLHGAYVTGYRSPDFDYAEALRSNTDGLRPLLERLAGQGLQNVIATGSVFEADEGMGEEPLRAFSAYGLSKTLTWKAQQYLTEILGLRLGKFLIANPFGPYEEPRFTAYLMKTWFSGKLAEVRTPAYIRDNIHVSNLAAQYLRFAEARVSGGGGLKCAPMGYVESQGAFTLRFAAEMRKRLGIACDVELKEQTVFEEPLARANTQRLLLPEAVWNESRSWDELAEWYRAEFGKLATSA